VLNSLGVSQRNRSSLRVAAAFCLAACVVYMLGWTELTIGLFAASAGLTLASLVSILLARRSHQAT
jgi:hypothetical protein